MDFNDDRSWNLINWSRMWRLMMLVRFINIEWSSLKMRDIELD